MTDKLEVGQLRIWTVTTKCSEPFILVFKNSLMSAYHYVGDEMLHTRTNREIAEISRVLTKLEKLLLGMTDNE